MTTTREPDPEKLLAKIGDIGGLAFGARVAAMVYLGVKMGLYRSLKGAGPGTSAELAERTGLSERWLREWLRGQAAAGILDYPGDGRFELSVETAVLLAEEGSMSYMGGHFESLPHQMAIAERLPESFRTGLGLAWDERGQEAAEITERMFGNWYRQVLVPTALPLLDGAVESLASGAKVADVGCGAGVALLEMAKAFRGSQFHGYEISEHALARAEENKTKAGLENLAFHNVANDPLPADESFHLIATLDCLHDMTQPKEAAAAVRAALRPDGVWFIADINGAPTFEENLSNPLAARAYAMSVLCCMSSALSEPGGAGLGTLGLPEPAMRELVQEAGFSQFRRLDLPHPVNAFYEVKR